MKTYYIRFESFPDLDRSLKRVLHIESWQPLCWANSTYRTIKASAEHSACFVTLENIFMQIFYERCCLLFSQSGSSAKLRAGGCFHKVSSDFFYPLPSLVCTDSVALCCCCRGLWREKKEKETWPRDGAKLEYLQDNQMTSKHEALACFIRHWTAFWVTWRCPRVTQYDRKSGENSLPSLSGTLATMWIRSVPLSQQSLRCLPTSPTAGNIFPLAHSTKHCNDQ